MKKVFNSKNFVRNVSTNFSTVFGKLDSLITLPFFSVTTKQSSLITKISWDCQGGKSYKASYRLDPEDFD